MNVGWICPRCSKVHAPDVKGCECVGYSLNPVWPTAVPTRVYDCGCPLGQFCQSTACPRGMRVTCSTVYLRDGVATTVGMSENGIG